MHRLTLKPMLLLDVFGAYHPCTPYLDGAAVFFGPTRDSVEISTTGVGVECIRCHPA